MSLFNLFNKKSAKPEKKTSAQLNDQPIVNQKNIVYTVINTTHSKARFEDNQVYLINEKEELIGRYTNADEKGKINIYNEQDRLIGNISAFSYDGFFVQLRGSSNSICVNAHEDGYIEEVDGEYRNVAYLQNRMSPISHDRLIGMAASFVCLQAAARDNQNRFSLLYY